jgi:hypothetical protein
MKAGSTVKAGRGLKIVGTPDRKSPIEAGIINPKAVSKVFDTADIVRDVRFAR